MRVASGACAVATSFGTGGGGGFFGSAVGTSAGGGGAGGPADVDAFRDSEDGGGGVEVLAEVPDERRLERLLDGWRERCGQPGSLRWLRGRTAAPTARRRRRRLGPGLVAA